MDLPTRLALKAARRIVLALGRGVEDSTLLAVLDIDSIAATIDRETRLPEWKKALEGLTPSGSEFVDDPEACAAYVRGRLDAAQEGFKDSIIRCRKIEDATTELLLALKKLIGNSFACGTLLAGGFGHAVSEIREAAQRLRVVLEGRESLAAKVSPEKEDA